MGKSAPGSADFAVLLSSNNPTAFVGTGMSAPLVMGGLFNFSLWGTFLGTAVLVKSFDAGTTWLIARDIAGNLASLTGSGTMQINEPEAGVMYAVQCTLFTSGTINYRISR